jgi:hypothetical protein
MKQRLLIAFLTMVVLGAGYVAGVWTERRSCKVPPPPALLGELSTSKRPADAKPASTPAPNAAELAAKIEQLRPQIEEFRVRLNELDRVMDREIDEILTPTQRVKFAGIVKYYADLRAKEDAAVSRGAPLTAEEVTRLQQQPLYTMLGIVVIPLRLHWTTRDLELDAAQQEKLRQILVKRRNNFIALVDAYPPPSLELSKLAPAAQRLIGAKK